MYQLFKWLGLCRTNKNTKPCHWVRNNANLIMQSCNQGALNLIPAFISSCLTVTDRLPLRPSVVAFSYISDFFFNRLQQYLEILGQRTYVFSRGSVETSESVTEHGKGWKWRVSLFQTWKSNILRGYRSKYKDSKAVSSLQSDWSGTRQTKDNRRINIDGRQNVLKIDTLEKLRIIIWK